MLSYNLDSLESAKQLINFCDRFKGQMEIDVLCGRQVIDGFSALGIYSLIGKTVTVHPLTNDKNVVEQFEKEFVDIAQWKRLI